mgnify:CR=1 FL=1
MIHLPFHPPYFTPPYLQTIYASICAAICPRSLSAIASLTPKHANETYRYPTHQSTHPLSVVLYPHDPESNAQHQLPPSVCIDKRQSRWFCVFIGAIFSRHCNRRWGLRGRIRQTEEPTYLNGCEEVKGTKT